MKYIGLDFFNNDDTLLGISTMNGVGGMDEEDNLIILPGSHHEGEPITIIRVGIVLINLTIIF